MKNSPCINYSICGKFCNGQCIKHKREQFAMFAMQGILANGKCSQFTDTIDLIAEASIRLADALIEALNNSSQS